MEYLDIQTAIVESLRTADAAFIGEDHANSVQDAVLGALPDLRNVGVRNVMIELAPSDHHIENFNCPALLSALEMSTAPYARLSTGASILDFTLWGVDPLIHLHQLGGEYGESLQRMGLVAMMRTHGMVEACDALIEADEGKSVGVFGIGHLAQVAIQRDSGSFEYGPGIADQLRARGRNVVELVKIGGLTTSRDRDQFERLYGLRLSESDRKREFAVKCVKQNGNPAVVLHFKERIIDRRLVNALKPESRFHPGKEVLDAIDSLVSPNDPLFYRLMASQIYFRSWQRRVDESQEQFIERAVKMRKRAAEVFMQGAIQGDESQYLNAADVFADVGEVQLALDAYDEAVRVGLPNARLLRRGFVQTSEVRDGLDLNVFRSDGWDDVAEREAAGKDLQILEDRIEDRAAGKRARSLIQERMDRFGMHPNQKERNRAGGEHAAAQRVRRDELSTRGDTFRNDRGPTYRFRGFPPGGRSDSGRF